MLVEKFRGDLYYSRDGKVWIFELAAFKKEFIRELSRELENDEKLYLRYGRATFVKSFGDKTVYVDISEDTEIACTNKDDFAKTVVEVLRGIAETVYNDKKDDEEKKITFKIDDLLD